jgi:hypothetical protein
VNVVSGTGLSDGSNAIGPGPVDDRPWNHDAEDASTDPAMAVLLRKFEAADARIEVVRRRHYGHISKV